MGRHIAPVIHWVEEINVQPAAWEERACCLEPNEILFVRLTASDPFDAAFVDWGAYQTWSEDGADDMPAGGQFTNDTRDINWEAETQDAPYIMVLVIFNPGKRVNRIGIEIGVSTVLGPRRSNSAPSGDPAAAVG